VILVACPSFCSSFSYENKKNKKKKKKKRKRISHITPEAVAEQNTDGVGLCAAVGRLLAL
jgi:hypothetical protein